MITLKELIYTLMWAALVFPTAMFFSGLISGGGISTLIGGILVFIIPFIIIKIIDSFYEEIKNN